MSRKDAAAGGGPEELLIENGVLVEYLGFGGNVTVPEGVTHIGPLAFGLFSNSFERYLRFVELTGRPTPPTGTEEGLIEFRERCGGPESVSLPESLREIGKGAFRGCRRLRSVSLPKSLKALPTSVFEDCKALESLSLPESLREIGEAAFRDCRSLRSLSLPEGLKALPPSAFERCEALESVSLPESLRRIGDYAFRDCRSLRSISLPEGLEELPPSLFEGCGALESVSLPESLREIGQNAFKGCGRLRSLRLPKGVKRIGRDAFRGCVGLADKNDCCVAQGVLLLYAGPGGDVTVPEGVKRIVTAAFDKCRDQPRFQPFAPRRPKSSLTLLRSVRLPEGLECIEAHAFRGCEDLESVSLPGTLRELGEGAFRDCRRLRTISLPEGLETIPESAFEGCEALESVSLPGTLRELGPRAFLGCGSLKAAALPEGLRKLGATVFGDCRSLKTAALPEGLEAIPASAFAGCEALESVSLPETLRELGPRAFAGCGSLRSLRFPEGLRKFGEEALQGCGGLADENGFVIKGGTLFQYAGPGGDVTVPEGVTRIDHYALAKLPGTVRLRLPDSLTDVAYDAFRGSRLILRVRRWLPGFDRAVNCCEFTAVLTETCEGVPEVLDHAARYGAAFWPEAAFSEEKTREDAAWLAGHTASLREDALRMPELLHYLCKNRLIPPTDADDWLEEARRRDPAGLAAVLLDYLNELGPETLAQAREARQARKEFSSAARMRRIARAGPGIAGLRIALDKRIDLRSWSGITRAQLTELLAAHGARLQPELISRIDYLLSDDAFGSSGRYRRAVALGIPVITSKELRKLAGL